MRGSRDGETWRTLQNLPYTTPTRAILSGPAMRQAVQVVAMSEMHRDVGVEQCLVDAAYCFAVGAVHPPACRGCLYSRRAACPIGQAAWEIVW